MDGGHLRELLNLTSEELTALDLATEQFNRLGLLMEAQELKRLKDKILALVPRAKKVRIETDHEALLEARGFIARPGPRPKIDQTILLILLAAIKACRLIEIKYHSHRDTQPKPRIVAVYGLLYALRHYVVGRDVENENDSLRTYRLDAIASAKIRHETYEIPQDFELQEFANRAFGVYQNDDEYTTVVWKFTAKASANARSYQFHPNQKIKENRDGSVLITFKAAGLLEMCWHLYSWGGQVEVIEPIELREMVKNCRRDDFPAIP